MNRVRISFIVPVYKVEEFFDYCIQSVVCQLENNMEIILVDDGSPDSCPEKCDEWSAKDNRIHVLHKANGGLSDARNVGLSVAQGDYVWFVDSDDWLMPNAIETLQRAMDSFPGADVYSTALSYYQNDEWKKWDFKVPETDAIMSGMEYVNRKYKTGASQRFVICRSLLLQKNLCFIKGVLHEDGPFGFMLMYYAESVVVLSKSVYCYRQRDGSIMHSLTIRSSYDLIKNHKSLMEFEKGIDSPKKRRWFRVLSSRSLVNSYMFVPHLFDTAEFYNFEKANKRYIQKELLRVIPFLNIKAGLKYLLICIAPKTTVKLLQSRG